MDAIREETVGADSQDGPQTWGTRFEESVFGKLGTETIVPCWAPPRESREEWLEPLWFRCAWSHRYPREPG